MGLVAVTRTIREPPCATDALHPRARTAPHPSPSLLALPPHGTALVRVRSVPLALPPLGYLTFGTVTLYQEQRTCHFQRVQRTHKALRDAGRGHKAPRCPQPATRNP